MTVAEGTPRTIDGLAVGAETRRRAHDTGRPVAYVVLTDQGWYWAAAAGGVPHLVPPYGDRSHCGRPLRRADRSPVTRGVAERACQRCWHAVLGDIPRRSRA